MKKTSNRPGLSGGIGAVTLTAILLWLNIACGQTVVAAQDSVALQALQEQAAAMGSVRVILQLDRAAAPELERQQDQLLERLNGKGIKQYRKYKYIPYLALELDPAGLEAALQDPAVSRIQADRLYAPALAGSVPRIGAPAAWTEGYTGTGQMIAVLDTGVDTAHPFLAGKVVHEACFSTGSAVTESLCPNSTASQTGPGAADPCSDGCEHGTHVAGIAAGNGEDFSGVARDAGIMAIQVFSRVTDTALCGGTSGCVLAYTSDLISALEHVYDHRNSFTIAAVNLSLGNGRYTNTCDTEEPALTEAIDRLRQEQIATVAASGNEAFTDGISSPACISTAISVGAVDGGDSVAPFSNSGQLLDLLAPGTLINSSLPGGGYASLSGTSMAAPHVAGALAVLRSKTSAAFVNELFYALQVTGLPVSDSRNGLEIPLIQVDAALARVGQVTEQPSLAVTPEEAYSSNGLVGGPFMPDNRTYTLRNTGPDPLEFAVGEGVSWLTVSPAGGTLQANEGRDVTVTIDTGATTLAEGHYTTALTFHNLSNGLGDTSRVVDLKVLARREVANDKFRDSIELTESSGATTGSNREATREPGEPAHAGNPGGRSVWWHWTAPAAGELTVNTFGSSFDTLLAAYIGTEVNSLIPVAENDDASGLQSRISFIVQTGVTYRIAVDGFDGAMDDIVLAWEFSAGPVGRNPLAVTPATGFSSSGTVGGPFEPVSITYTLINLDSRDLPLQIQGLPDWIQASQLPAQLATGASIEVPLQLDADAAAALEPGIYSAQVLFNTVTRPLRLAVIATGNDNDQFADAATIPVIPAKVFGTNAGAGKEDDEPDHAGNSGGRSIWWRYTVPAATGLTVDTAGSDFDTLLAVYAGSALTGLTELAASDDANSDLTSRVNLGLNTGETIFIAVDGYGGADGTVVLNINPDLPPGNDNSTGAITLTGVPVTGSGSNRSATREAGEPVHAGNEGGGSVWWRWTSPVNDTVIISTTGSSFDTLLAVYTGDQLDELTVVASDDDQDTDNFVLTSEVAFEAAAGTTYLIAVDGYLDPSLPDNEQGDVELSINATDPANRTLEVALIGSGTVTGNPPGIDCPGACSSLFNSAGHVDLTAVADPGWVFDRWSGNCSGTGYCTVTMTADRAVTARFLVDTDMDSLPDDYELNHGLNPLDGADASADSDFDGLINSEEYELGIAANNPDTDGDGVNDGAEIAAGRNPAVNEAAVLIIIME